MNTFHDQYKNFSSPYIHLVRGPAEVTLVGTCQVLGKDVSNNKVFVAAGKILPFEINSDSKINIELSEGGKSWVTDYFNAGTAIWQDVIRKIFAKKVRTLLIIGDTDTGKSTLATYLLNLALKHAYRPAIIDADTGQGDLAPPNAIGSAVVTEQITDLREVDAQFFEFIGNTSPLGFEDIIIKAVKSALTKIHSYCNLCIINTDGYILNKGIDYKIKMAKELQPDIIVCLGELPVFDRFRIKTSSLVLYGRTTYKMKKSRNERSERRLTQYIRYIREHDKNKITIRELKKAKFVYRGITYSRIRIDARGFLLLGRSVQLEPKKLVGMFVGLGFQENIVGFGIITTVSQYRISIQTTTSIFNKVYLSNSGISKYNTLEFRTSISGHITRA
jgi:polynucleotide 5'-hydroxyl-kinase GRC3/NOL9